MADLNGGNFSPIIPNTVFTSSIPVLPLTTLRLGITPVQDDFLLPVPSYTATHKLYIYNYGDRTPNWEVIW